MAQHSESRAEEHYLDAIEAQDSSDREGALSSARQAVKLNPDHAEAWWLISSLELPEKGGPDLQQASRCLSACRKVVALEPENESAWVRGGQLLADELGMYEEAVMWWQQRREGDPLCPVSIIEQSALLADLGLYSRAATHMRTIVDHDLEISPQQYARVHRLSGLLDRAAEQENSDHFRPWEKNHPGWLGIQARMKKAPESESLLFLMFVTPFLVLEVYFSKGLSGGGFWPFCFTSLILLLTVGLGIRFTRRLFHKVNRPAFDLLRAMDIESTSGYLLIPSDIRMARLYMTILGRRPKAYQERMMAIIEESQRMPKGWRPDVPDLEIEIDYEDEEFDEEGVNEVPGFGEEE